VGHVFQGRYKAIVCKKDAYLLELVRYIHLNPVRAGLVDSPEDYPWSSHRIYLGIDKSEVIDPSLVLKQFSDGLFAGIRSYESFVMEGSRQGRRDELYKVSDQRILGDEEFHKTVFRRRGDEASESAGMPTVHFELDEVEGIMQSAMGLEPGSLRSGGRFITWSRRIFCYIARTYGSHKGNDVAGHIGRDLATVTYNVRFVENLVRGGDQKTIDLINGIRDDVARRRFSFQDEKECRKKRKLKI